MRFHYLVLMAVVAAGSVCAEEREGSFFVLQERLVDVFADNRDAVVRIKAVTETERDGDPKVSLLVGTGFFISADAHLLTNASVVFEADRILVEHESVLYRAELQGLDRETNIALLRLDRKPGSFSYLPIDDLAIQPIGTMAVSIACALEFSPAPAIGIVTGHETNFGERVFPTSYLRTTLPANPGEGGAPVLDLSGRFIGMIIASLPEMASSYVIPAAAVKRVRDDLLLEGEVRHGWMGFEVEVRGDPEIGPYIEVTHVVDGGPADQAGLEPGDRIVTFDGVEVEGVTEMRSRSFFARVGQTLAIVVEREGNRRSLAIAIAERPGVGGVAEKSLSHPYPAQ